MTVFEKLYEKCWNLTDGTFHVEVLTDYLGCCTVLNWTARMYGFPYQMMITIREHDHSYDEVARLLVLLDQAYQCLRVAKRDHDRQA